MRQTQSVQGHSNERLLKFFSEGKDQNQKTIMLSTSFKSLSLIVAIALCTIPRLQGRSLDDGHDGQAARSRSLSVNQEGTYTLCFTSYSVFVKFCIYPGPLRPQNCINDFIRKLTLAAVFVGAQK